MKYTAFILILLFISCSASKSSKRSRGSLSDAMGKASDKNKGSREVESDDEEDEGSGFSIFDIFSSTNNDDDEKRRTRYREEEISYVEENNTAPKINYGSIFSLNYNNNRANLNGSIISNNQFGIQYLSKSSDRNSTGFGVYLNYGESDLASQKLSESIKNISFFNLGLVQRLGLSENKTFAGSFLELAAGYTHFSWTYQNPIKSESEYIKRDAVGGIDLSMGLGLILFQKSNFQLVPSINAGIKLLSDETSKGFDEDFFKSSSHINFKIALEF
jgi:hypothetical protein